MQKPLALSIAACLTFAGCHVFEKSETWDQAVRVRPGETAFDPDPSQAYAAKLHAELIERGVEHKVVVYQYHYTTRLHEEALGTRTAVIYRDNSNSSYPWWLKDDRLNNPFWLPNGDLDKQISFYIRRKAEVIETKEYPARGASGKSSIAFAKPAPSLRPMANPAPQMAGATIPPARKAPTPVAAQKPAPTSQIVRVPAVVKTPEVKAPAIVKAPETVKAPIVVKAPEAVKMPDVVKAPEVIKAPAVVKAPEPKKATPEESVAKVPVTKINQPIAFFSPQRTPEPEAAPLPPIASRNSGNNPLWAPPAVLDSKEQSTLTAPRDERLEKLFRTKHGSEYNRFSPTDRRKMQQLQHEVASRD